MSRAENIHFAHGVYKRVIRSRHTYHGQPVAAIHDDGWLVSIQWDGEKWIPLRAIRELRREK